MQSRHTYENEILILKLQNLIHRLSSVKHCSNERYLKRMQSVGYGPALGAVSFEAVVGLRTSSRGFLLVTRWIVLLRRSSFVLGGIRTSVFSRCVLSGFVPRSIVSEFIYRTGAGAVVLIWCVLLGFVPRSIVHEVHLHDECRRCCSHLVCSFGLYSKEYRRVQLHDGCRQCYSHLVCS